MADEIFQLRPDVDALLQSERARVLDLLHRALPTCEVAEVGSTAVPGAIGKQDVDIVVLADVGQFDATCAILDRYFTRDELQLSTDCYRGYRASAVRDVSIQVTVRGGPYDTFQAFADALKNDGQLLQAYNDLKRQWDGKSMDDYRIAKSDFIAKAIKRSDLS